MIQPEETVTLFFKVALRGPRTANVLFKPALALTMGTKSGLDPVYAPVGFERNPIFSIPIPRGRLEDVFGVRNQSH